MASLNGLQKLLYEGIWKYIGIYETRTELDDALREAREILSEIAIEPEPLRGLSSNEYLEWLKNRAAKRDYIRCYERIEDIEAVIGILQTDISQMARIQTNNDP